MVPIVPRGHRSSSWVAWAVSGVLVHAANLIEARRLAEQGSRPDSGKPGRRACGQVKPSDQAEATLGRRTIRRPATSWLRQILREKHHLMGWDKKLVSLGGMRY